jgi:AAA domain/UvrD-like helicase C-terminal domain
MTLSPGAVELPLAHLSARVAWHDTDWTGRVCQAPAANHACTILKNVKERKDSDQEEADAGAAWADLADLGYDRVPPCVFERAGFMRAGAFTIEREHAYASFSKSHKHFARTAHRMPAYSLEATPYRWVMREETPDRVKTWNIGYDQSLEDEADKHIELSKKTTWVQDHRNQLALLDSFFSAIKPGKSLVLIYVKDLPLLEDRAPGERVLVGAGLVREVAPSVEWRYSTSGPLRSIMWERAVTHSIRPEFDDGFLLPYQQLLARADLQGEDLSEFVAHAPAAHFDEFSYVSELVSHDGAIAALLELARVVDLLPGIADGPWDSVASWLSDRIADAWTFRGPYPGLGAALAAAGLERGAVIAHRVVESLPDPATDPWGAVAQAIEDAASDRGVAAGLVGRMARKAWERVSANAERYALLRLLSRFSLTTEQARRLFDPELRTQSGIGTTDAEMLQNPYLLFELDRGRLDSIGFGVIDRGLFPRDAGARAALDADALPDPVRESVDDRRVRAACTELLERAADQGHTLLDEPGLRKRLATLQLDPACDPTSDVFGLAAEDFPPVLIETPLARDGRGWQLARLAQAGDLIAADVATRINGGPIDLAWEWRHDIDKAIDEPISPNDADEELARDEKAEALRILARSRIAALVGPAGTGKTTMLRALCSHPEVEGRGVLLLAPTGKARVQLGHKVKARALTLAQCLRPSGRWHSELGYRVIKGADRQGGFGTVVVDEASMLTEEMLAALIDALVGVERLVLCGDHRQLPPIGAGRPFADLVAHLRSLSETDAKGGRPAPETGGGLAELTIGRRARARPGADGTTTVVGRDDLAVASWFSVDGGSPAADEVMGRVLADRGDGTLRIVSWEDEDDLHAKLVEFLANDPELSIRVGDADALRRSLGATGTYNGRPSFVFGSGGAGAERWQILTPVRSRPGGVSGLNRLVRLKWRAGDATRARKSWKLPPPMGADEILFYDKVMCVTNHQREAWQVAEGKKRAGDVANGEIGMAVHWAGRKGLKVEFSTQPGVQFTFWASDLNADRERLAEALELAYAVTVHKAQGSQFEITAVVIPNPCPLLSPELLYTALTRQRSRTVLFIQGDPNDLRLLASPWQSETARRLTRLFRPPDPFAAPDGHTLDGSHIHKTANGEMVISKSEVIVANTLKSLSIKYLYEQDLQMPDGSWRRPDFTIYREGGNTVYWEHLGMLESAGYRADWEAKQDWYAGHGILPWADGGGPNGTLVWSTESRRDGIDAQEIEKLAREVFAIAL